MSITYIAAPVKVNNLPVDKELAELFENTAPRGTGHTSSSPMEQVATPPAPVIIKPDNSLFKPKRKRRHVEDPLAIEMLSEDFLRRFINPIIFGKKIPKKDNTPLSEDDTIITDYIGNKKVESRVIHLNTKDILLRKVFNKDLLKNIQKDSQNNNPEENNDKIPKSMRYLTRGNIEDHLNNKETFYYVSSLQFDVIFMMYDIDFHQKEAEKSIFNDSILLFNHLNEICHNKRLYHEKSTNGAGIHSYIFIDLSTALCQSDKIDIVNRVKEYEEIVAEYMELKGFTAKLEMKGYPAYIDWYKRNADNNYLFTEKDLHMGQLAKIPRFPDLKTLHKFKEDHTVILNLDDINELIERLTLEINILKEEKAKNNDIIKYINVVSPEDDTAFITGFEFEGYNNGKIIKETEEQTEKDIENKEDRIEYTKDLDHKVVQNRNNRNNLENDHENIINKNKEYQKNNIYNTKDLDLPEVQLENNQLNVGIINKNSKPLIKVFYALRLFYISYLRLPVDFFEFNKYYELLDLNTGSYNAHRIERYYIAVSIFNKAKIKYHYMQDKIIKRLTDITPEYIVANNTTKKKRIITLNDLAFILYALLVNSTKDNPVKGIQRLHAIIYGTRINRNGKRAKTSIHHEKIKVCLDILMKAGYITRVSEYVSPQEAKKLGIQKRARRYEITNKIYEIIK